VCPHLALCGCNTFSIFGDPRSTEVFVFPLVGIAQFLAQVAPKAGKANFMDRTDLNRRVSGLDCDLLFHVGDDLVITRDEDHRLPSSGEML
jgi:hypothetical protein